MKNFLNPPVPIIGTLKKRLLVHRELVNVFWQLKGMNPIIMIKLSVRFVRKELI